MPRPSKRQKLSHTPEPKKRLSEDELEEVRKRNEQKLQGRFSAIYAKYERDFGETSDEVDLVSGEVIVDNGHLRHMRHERDVGDRNPRALLEEQEDDEEAGDELASFNEAGQVSVWSDPEPEVAAESWPDISDRLAAQVVKSAMHSGTQLDMSDPAFINSFSMNIMRQVAQVMQTLQTNRAPLNDLGSPSVNARMQLPSAKIDTTTNSAPRRRKRNSVGLPSQRASSVSNRPSRGENGAFDDSSNVQIIRHGRKPTFAVIGRRRYTSHENRLVIELMQRGEPDWDEARRKLPDRTEVAIRVQWGRLRRAGKTMVKDVRDDLAKATPKPRIPAKSDADDQAPNGERNTPKGGDEDQHHSSSAGLRMRPRRQLQKASTKAAVPVRMKPAVQREKWSRSEDDRLVKLWSVDKLSLHDIAHHFPGRSEGAISNRFRYRLYVNNREDPAEQDITERSEHVEADLGALKRSERDNEQDEDGEFTKPEVPETAEPIRPSHEPTDEPQVDEVEDHELSRDEVEIDSASAPAIEIEPPITPGDSDLPSTSAVEPKRQTLVSGFQISAAMDCLEKIDAVIPDDDPASVARPLSQEGDATIEPTDDNFPPSNTNGEDDEDELTRDMVLTSPRSATKALTIRPRTTLSVSYHSTPASRNSTTVHSFDSGGLSRASAGNKTGRSGRRSGELLTPDPSSPSYDVDQQSSRSERAATGKLRSIRKRGFAAVEEDESEDELAH